jgi:hypothetical protein
MNRRGGETIEWAADRFIDSILADARRFAFGRQSKMWPAAVGCMLLAAVGV